MNATLKAHSLQTQPSAPALITLFDLVSAANDVTSSEDEALATVVALLRSGRAKFVA